MENVYLVLDSIRSVHNVGSILRTADGAGVKKVYLCGCTPTPVDRFGRKRSDMAKVALGAEESVSTVYARDTLELVAQLKAEGVFVIGVEQDKCAVSYTTCRVEKPTALILGEETRGLTKEVRDACDALIEIPMYGTKESLNVSVAAGIILFELTQQFA